MSTERTAWDELQWDFAMGLPDRPDAPEWRVVVSTWLTRYPEHRSHILRYVREALRDVQKQQ